MCDATPFANAAAAADARPAPNIVDSLDAPILESEDRHHFERVLRIRSGDTITICDGNGSWRSCRFGSVIEPIGPIISAQKPQPALTIGFSIPKGDRPETTVQKLTELGVDRIVVLHAERTVVRWEGDRATRHLVRLRRIAREAAMQSRRPWLPEVSGPMEATKLAAEPGAALCEPGGAPPTLDHPVLLVGPEGGWSQREVRPEGGMVGLGPHILRVDTAALSAGVLLVALRSRTVTPTPIVVNDAVRG